MKTEIVYEDQDLLIVYKPAGLAVQTASVTQKDVVTELCSYLKTTYIGLVHRLDQPVEGLMAVAKTKEAAAALSRQLTDGTMKKTYYAVVCKRRDMYDRGQETTGGAWNMCDRGQETTGGAWNMCDRGQETTGDVWTCDGQEYTVLSDYLVKDKKTKTARIVTDLAPDRRPKEAAVATLFYRVLQEREQTALCEIVLQTGRFHQIRAQFSHAKMPLLGDKKYADAQSAALSEALSVNDVALCAAKLSFVHPRTKKKTEYSIRPRKPVFNSYEF